MKTRPTAAYYALTFATGGLFGVYWIYLMMSDVNAISEKPRLPAHTLPMLGALFGFGAVVLLVTGPDQNLAPNIFSTTDKVAISLALMGSLILLSAIILTYQQILALLHMRFTLASGAFIFVGTILLAMSSLPYMQSLINRMLLNKPSLG